ncbi:MAG: hypothetical protein LBB78_00095 [Spirochaetaceae bacterium]|jgi:hypothetical protein|nr:hypothetical protein [Spirochaetaceae bacterium]
MKETNKSWTNDGKMIVVILAWLVKAPDFLNQYERIHHLMDKVIEKYPEAIEYLRRLQEFDPVKVSYLLKNFEQINDMALQIKASANRIQNAVKYITSRIENSFIISYSTDKK